jgi:hypothetical protein
VLQDYIQESAHIQPTTYLAVGQIPASRVGTRHLPGHQQHAQAVGPGRGRLAHAQILVEGDTMKTVWVVTSGKYSDYCIQSIFSTKDKADAYVNLNNAHLKDYDRYNEPEEYGVDIPRLLNGSLDFIVYLPRHGEALIELRDIGSFVEESPDNVFVHIANAVKATPDRILKIAQDRRVELLAKQERV